MAMLVEAAGPGADHKVLEEILASDDQVDFHEMDKKMLLAFGKKYQKVIL